MTSTLPTRSATTATRSSTLSEDDAIPDENTSETTKLFSERLRAWKHACAYLEDYIKATEKMQHAHGKEYEKVLKTVSHPLKEGDHFDQQAGGVAGMFENIRSNTQGIANSHTETAKILKGTILPIFERLHTEVKAKDKELIKGAGKGGKAVDKARTTTQKHIELLAQHTAAFDSTGGKVTAHDDPYIIQRGVNHRLNKQIQEENANRQDMIQVQNSFAQFEAHILQTVQHGLDQFNQVVGNQADQTKLMYGDMTATAQSVPANFEWDGFVKRNSALLIDPSAPLRSLSTTTFPNQNHKSTQPMIAGSLERKGKLMGKYSPGYYVVTPSKFLHEYKTDDDLAKDPSPENSLYLPDCIVGALDGTKFAVKGKDASKGKFGVSMTHEYQFKAHTAKEAEQWYSVINSLAGSTLSEKPESSTPSSPVVGQGSHDNSLDARTTAPLQTSGITGGETVASPTAATPTAGKEGLGLAQAMKAEHSGTTAAAPAYSATPAVGSASAAPTSAVPDKI
ncbi:PH domain-containing protein [Venturia nashicola]|nr:PH domain-containing protein [Venturia nashicola]